ncbi:hypothetical protein ACRBEV_25015 [Methylobacterium phyllosphaerae]
MADNRPTGKQGQSGNRQGSSQHGGSSGDDAGLADQARETLRSAADRASDAWDNASEYGSRYYRQGSRAVSDMDNGTMTGLLIAGAIGFGLGWLIFGQQSRSGDYIPRRMSRSSERDY